MKQETKRRLYAAVAWVYAPIVTLLCPWFALMLLLHLLAVVLEQAGGFLKGVSEWMSDTLVPPTSKWTGMRWLIDKANELSPEEKKAKLERRMNYGMKH